MAALRQAATPDPTSSPSHLFYRAAYHAVREQNGAIEQENAILQERIVAYERGELIMCIAPGCNNLLLDRLLAGEATCSAHCKGTLDRRLTRGDQQRERRRLARLKEME